MAKRNARERRRVQAVNQAFYRLRKCVPIENRNKRVSKVKTLQRAIDYIRKLERILAEDEDEEQPASAESQRGHQLVSSAGANLLAPAERRPRRPTNCDLSQQHQQQQEQQAAAQETNCQQQPQIMRQKRARKTTTAPPVSPKLAQQQQQRQHSATSAAMQPALAADCQQLAPAYAGQPQRTQLATEEGKFAPIDTYYGPFANSTPPAAYAAHSQQQVSEVLRESSAYNSNLNYYANQQQQQPQQQQQQYTYAAAPTQAGSLQADQPFDLYANSSHTASFYVAPPPPPPHSLIAGQAAYTSAYVSPPGVGPAQTPTMKLDQQAWRQLAGQGRRPELRAANLSHSLGSESSTSSASTAMTPLDSSASLPPDSSSLNSTFALLHSPSPSASAASSASPSSSAAAVAASSAPTRSSLVPAVADSARLAVAQNGSPNSGQRAANKPPSTTTSVCNNANSGPQVNSYVACANISSPANRMAAHLSFAVATGGANNDNNLAGLRQQQQSGESRAKCTGQPGSGPNSSPADSHQARLALGHPNQHQQQRLAAGLHEQQQYHQQYQHTSFQANQLNHHLGQSNLSGLQPAANNALASALTHQHQHQHQHQHHKPSIQEYTL